jgi:putative nucleotidyltransferase with HDIG domain
MSVDFVRQVGVVRDTVVRDVLGSVPPKRRTVLVEVIVGELLDYIGDALGSQETSALEIWLQATYDRYPGMTGLTELLEGTTRALGAAGRGEGWLREGEFAAVAAAVTRIASLPRLIYGAAERTQIDEIDVVINNLINRVFEKDVLTGEHSRAVALWCLRLARKLGFAESEAQYVQRGGMLHDIGKIAVPNEILNAPRRLSAEERLIIERHAAQGGEMVGEMPILIDFLPIVRSHHERLDGKGYPDGLHGEQIPLAVRIVSVADCFNAMIGRRPYRPPLSPSIALEELSRHSGTQFDPEVVAAMIGVVEGQSEAL